MRVRAAFSVLFVLSVCVAFPAVALGLTAQADASAPGKARISTTMSSIDPTGTIVVTVDGVEVGASSVRPGDSTTFSDVELAPGWHSVSAVVRSRDRYVGSPARTFRVWGRPLSATLLAPSSPAGAWATAIIGVPSETSSIELKVNGVFVRSSAAMPGTAQNMGTIGLKKGYNTIEIVARNPVASSSKTFKVLRLDYPWPTCIIIDKSDRKLYWVRDGMLVKTYPIAIGKANTPTPAAIWRIDAKYHTDPAGVYGPRKMRLFRQTSSGYVFTAYGIHGTNQPWVIGTMASHGCVRMYNHQVLELFPQVPLGTMVQTRE